FFVSTPAGLARIEAMGSGVKETILPVSSKAGPELLMVSNGSLYAFGVNGPSFNVSIGDTTGITYSPYPRRLAGYKAVVYKDHIYVAALTGLFRMKQDGTQPEPLNARFGLPDAAIVNDIFVDKHNNLWIATHGYGAIVWNADWITRTLPQEYPVQRLASDNGKIWIASNHQWAGWEGAAFSVKQYPFLNQATGWCLQTDGTWLFSDLYNLYAGKDPAHISPNAVYVNPVGLSGLCQWRSDTVFMATYGRGVVVLKNKKQVGVITSADGLCDDMVEKLFRLKNAVAASSYSKGLSLIGAGGKVVANISKQQGLPSNMVYFVGESGDSLLVGTRAGLSIFRNGQKLRDWGSMDGLTGTKVLNAFHDSNGHLWVVSDAAVFMFENNRLVKPFEYSSLPQSDFAISQSLYDSVSNALILAVGKEVIRIDLSGIPSENTQHSLSWQLLSVSGKTLQPGSSYTLPAASNHLKAICRLPYFLAQDAPVLEYKLEGYDTGWRQTRFYYNINYPGLPAGNYRLQARLMQRSGLPATVQTVVSFRIQKVWWQQWWFIACTVLAAMAFSAFVINRRNNVKLKRQQEVFKARMQLQEEREMISRELHDNVGSQLTFLAGNLELLQESAQHQLPAEAADMVASLSQSTRETINDVRESIWALKKPQVSATMLADRLENLVHSRFKNPNAPAIHFIKSFDEQMAFSPIIALNAFRIAQEGLSNALLHSKASEITLRMTQQDDNSLHIVIADNGKGIAAADWKKEEHYGLENMKRRAAEHQLNLEIDTEIGKGTQLKFVLPARSENNA
ncbi:MAG TPA: histidine kinase, partial [Phnomibacter sp.]|nr:histidine kinase [Phnomibacter sp.]